MEIDQNGTELVVRHNELSGLLYQQVAKSVNQGNVALEPIGLMNGLLAVGLGASGPAENEIQNFIWPNQYIRDTSQRFGDLCKRNEKDLMEGSFPQRPATKMNMFFNNVQFPDSNFSKELKDYFNPKLETTSKKTKLTDRMDKLVRKNTNSLMKVQLPDIEVDKSICLLDASSYQGKWKLSFRSGKPSARGFYFEKDDQPTKVKMMRTEGVFQYAKFSKLNARVLKLPYAKERHHMFIILPKERRGLAELERNLFDREFLTKWSKIRRKLSDTRVDVALPQFDVRSLICMKNMLEDMGVKKVFKRTTANLTKLSKNEDIYLSAFYQAVHVSVGKKGSQGWSALPRNSEMKNVDFMVDHPFLFVIMDSKTNLIQVIGRVVEPKLYQPNWKRMTSKNKKHLQRTSVRNPSTMSNCTIVEANSWDKPIPYDPSVEDNVQNSGELPFEEKKRGFWSAWYERVRQPLKKVIRGLGFILFLIFSVLCVGLFVAHVVNTGEMFE